ncbi:MAG: ATP--guanido phosphotransferase [Candidatus Eiseniibacteriota bacterium]
MTLAELGDRVGDWLDGSGPRAGIVLSSRVRLARNIAGVPFPHRADDVQRQRVYRRLLEAARSVPELRSAAEWDFESLTPEGRRVLVERHLATARLASGMGARGVLAAPGEGLAILVNEEDHLRIQSVCSGLNLAQSLDRAVAVDRGIEGLVEFAVSEERGYLTACPTNVGTGLRASVLIHLPALVLAGEIRKVHRAVGEMGMAVRGWFGEGSAALGDFYQLSNQRTLGRSEETTTAELQRITERVLDLEVAAREKLAGSETRRPRVLDRVFRSWGILTHARLLTADQLMACASDLRLGRWLGVSDAVPEALLNRLALLGQPAHLGLRSGRSLDDDADGWARAEWVRAEFAKLPAAGAS